MNASLYCNGTKDLPTMPILVFELFLNIMMTPIGCLLNLFLIYSILRSTLFHNNLRLLMGHLSAMAVWYNVASFGKSLYTLMVMYSEPCNLVTTLYNCKVQELISILPLQTMLYSLVAIGLERLYATLFYTTYDYTKNLYMSLTLIFCIWFAALTLQLSPLPHIPSGKILVCQNLLVINQKTALTLLIIGLVLEFFSVLIFTCTTCWDRIKLRKLMINQAQHTLSARFQLAQNVEINKIMLPSALAHLACFTLINSFPLSVVSGWDTTFEVKVQFIQGSLLLVDVFTILHALIIFRQNDRLRQQLGLAFPRLKKFFATVKVKPSTPDFSGAQETLRHFEFLEYTWNSQLLAPRIGKNLPVPQNQYKL